jgi:tryptophan synthase alpha chain
MAFDAGRLGKSGTAFAAAHAEGRAALVGYLPLGYPDVATSIEAIVALTSGTDGTGCDVVEIGIPYTDPVMDGIAIQRAGTAALQRGVHTRDVFGAVTAVAATGTPALVMTYWNLIEHYGVRAFARDFAAAGGAGLITPDLPPDEADEWMSVSDEYELDRVFLVAPSSTDERLAMTVAACRGWVYATAVMGVTGARTETSNAAPTLVGRVHSLGAGLPVGVGLGVSNGDQAASVGATADGVIVGSALVSTLLAAEAAGTPGDLTSLRGLVSDLAAGVRRAERS